ncbi:MAG: WG repeat-containing protein [Crocinitomicaceae bacterium]
MRQLLLLLALLIYIIGYSKNKNWTCINENGETIFRIEAMRVYEFKNGLARVYKNTLVNNQWVTGYGYINQKGEVVIPCDLEKAMDFESDVTWVKKKGEDFYRMINKQGKIIPTKEYKKVKNFFDFQKDTCAVFEDGKMGFVDSTGKERIPCKYAGSSVFTEGLASVCLANAKEEAYGFINRNGEAVIPLAYKQAGSSSFRKGLARASVGGSTVLVDKTGKIVFQTKKGNIQGHNYGRILVITKPNRRGWGWLDFNDKFVINPEYDYAQNFNEDGFAIVEKNGLKGVIDTTGKVIIPLEYETVYHDITKDGFFAGVLPSKGGAISMANAQKHYFDKNLDRIELDNIKYIMSARYGNRIPFSDMNNRKGYLNRNFEIAIPAIYSRNEFFIEGLAWVLD